MRALVVTAPHEAEVLEVPEPEAGPGELLVEVERVGICGTDVELYTGEMAYIDDGFMHFPMRLGHEWTGRVVAAGSPDDDGWVGKRVTGDTMLGCGRCEYCIAGHPARLPDAVRGRHPGRVGRARSPSRCWCPTRFALRDPRAREPRSGGTRRARRQRACALRRPPHVEPGHRVLVLGSGTIGLLAAQFALAAGAEVHVAGKREGSLALARSLGVQHTTTLDDVAASDESRFDSVIEATSVDDHARARRSPREAGRPRRLHRALDGTEPGRQPCHRAEGHHRGRHPVGVPRPGRRDRELRQRRGGPGCHRQRGDLAGGRAVPAGGSARGWTPGRARRCTSTRVEYRSTLVRRRSHDGRHRYRALPELVRIAPNESIEVVHEEAFGRLSQPQREEMFEVLDASAAGDDERPGRSVTDGPRPRRRRRRRGRTPARSGVCSQAGATKPTRPAGSSRHSSRSRSARSFRSLCSPAPRFRARARRASTMVSPASSIRASRASTADSDLTPAAKVETQAVLDSSIGTGVSSRRPIRAWRSMRLLSTWMYPASTANGAPS